MQREPTDAGDRAGFGVACRDEVVKGGPGLVQAPDGGCPVRPAAGFGAGRVEDADGLHLDDLCVSRQLVQVACRLDEMSRFVVPQTLNSGRTTAVYALTGMARKSYLTSLACDTFPQIMSTHAEVEALLRLIRDSALKALGDYEKHGGTAPRLQSTEIHPLDQFQNKIGFMKTIATLEGACEQLCSTLAPPTQTVLNRVQDYQWICMRTVVKHKIADEVAKHKGGVHINELAAAVKLHPTKLGSILRALASKHCFCEIAPDVFANNRLSMTLTTSHPMSSAVVYSSDRHEYIHCLPEYLADPSTGHSLRINETAFQYFVKERHPKLKGITFYQWMELP
ncbi:hypothetical protein D9619_008574 [Psilocybe cf. subviscida]|uniref:O-methyltransferase dimerisation domain-containing protein n=1 Tax=Psilocybe cf. subviscida TaxID=2480587 RepID=A0A8H5BAB7_9AGAR|nr:hypothetical protein D9619_008574 [Psilocybe cf. subviscida]